MVPTISLSPSARLRPVLRIASSRSHVFPFTNPASVLEMTVKQNATASKTTTTKKKTTTAGSSKTVTTKREEVGAVSKSSSSSSLQISDVSHISGPTKPVTYTVTETLPLETGEKITTYGETGATSTEYRHYIAKEDAHTSSNITQISSTLNLSTQNLSRTDEANATYTVVEPVEERLSYKSDSAWNGKFVREKPAAKTFKSSTTTTTKQHSSSVVKSSSSSRVTEVVDGKERVVDEKRREASSETEEHLSSRSGTGVTPEVHRARSSRVAKTAYDSGAPGPRTEGGESFEEARLVGDGAGPLDATYTIEDRVTTTTTYYDSRGNVVRTDTDAACVADDSKSVASDATYTLEDTTDSSAIRQTATDSRDFYGSSTGERVVKDDVYRSDGKTGWNGKFIYETPPAKRDAVKPSKKGDKVVSETYTTIQTKDGPTPRSHLETIYTETVYKSVDDLTDVRDSKSSFTNAEYATRSEDVSSRYDTKFVTADDRRDAVS